MQLQKSEHPFLRTLIYWCIYMLSAWGSTLCRVVGSPRCALEWPRVFWQTRCAHISTTPYIDAWPWQRHIPRGGGSEGPHTETRSTWTKNVVDTLSRCELCEFINSCVWNSTADFNPLCHVHWPVKLQVINLWFCFITICSLKMDCCRWSNVFPFFCLLRFIQEIEMNMGPGQAKQCQLRAFLTYYINDLFLNQVCQIKTNIWWLKPDLGGLWLTFNSRNWDWGWDWVYL